MFSYSLCAFDHLIPLVPRWLSLFVGSFVKEEREEESAMKISRVVRMAKKKNKVGRVKERIVIKGR